MQLAQDQKPTAWFVGLSIGIHVMAALALWRVDAVTGPVLSEAADVVSVALVALPSPIESRSPSVETATPPPVAARPAPRPEPVAEPIEEPPPPDPAPAVAAAAEPPPPVPPVASPSESSAGPAVSTAPSAAASETSSAVPDVMPRYVAQVRAAIDRNKRYPAISRRREEEGVVYARISIGLNGELREVDVRGSRSKSLRRATRSAVERAAPFPPPPRAGVVIEVPIRWQVHR